VPSFDTGQPEVVRGGDVGSSKQAVAPGDVLLCKINPRINRVWIVGDSTEHEQIGSTEWIRFPRHHDAIPGYLAYYLQLERVRAHLAHNASGVGGSLMRVKGSTISNELMPLPHVDVQSRVVARIDELFTELDDGEEELRRARAELETYRKSLLKAAVTGELTSNWRAANPPKESGADLLRRILDDRRARWEANPRNKGKRYNEPAAPDLRGRPDLPPSWAWARVEQLAIVDSGATPSGIEAASRDGGEVPWFKVSSMSLEGNEDHLRHSKWWLTRTQALSAGLRIFPAGSIVFPKLGGALLTNKRRILGLDGCLDLNNMAVTAIEPAARYIRDLFSEIDLAALSDGSVVPQLKRDAVENITIGLPGEQELKVLTAAIEDGLMAANDMLKVVRDKAAAAADLRQSILAAAFRGELIQ
jgi:type I restriction enzyme S subunit